MPSDMAAPGCYRCLFPARQLHNQGGHQVVMNKYDVVEKEGHRGVLFDVPLDPPEPADIWVLQQQNERIWPQGGTQALRQNGSAMVADVDDNYVELPAYNPSFASRHPYVRNDGVIMNREKRRRMSKRLGFKMEPNPINRLHMFKMMEQVDLITVTNPYLAELYSRFNKNVVVLRNYLEWDIWSDVIPQYKVRREGGRIRIGYLGVFAYRKADLNVIANVVPEVLRKYPHVDFVANSESVHDFLRVPADRRITDDEYDFWVPDKNYQVGVKTSVLDIGLVPMLMNGLSEGKSHLKGMEYNAAGIPFVASPTESYKNYWCDEGSNGFLAFTENDWLNKLSYLIEDDEYRREMGQNGRELAEQHTYQRHWKEWEEAYSTLLGSTHTRVAREAVKRHAVQKVTELSWMLEKAQNNGAMRVVVEVGSAGGGTFWSLCQTAEDDALLVSIDMPSGSPLDAPRGKDVYQGRDREGMTRMGKPNQKIVLLDGNSQEEKMRDRLIAALDGRDIDLLFIDADHRYEGVKRDFELYSPLVRPGGLIAFHDIDVQSVSKEAQVHKLWREVKAQYESWERFGTETWGWGRWGGIGILRTEKKRTPARASVR